MHFYSILTIVLIINHHKHIFFQPPDTYMKPIVKAALDSASAMRLTFPVSDKLGAEVQLTCLSTIPGFLNHKADYHDYADYRSSSIIGNYWVITG